MYRNAEAGIGLICACLPALSSYIASLKSRANSSYRSYKSHELSSWNKLGSSKKGSGNHSSAFPPSQTDQACLISTIEAETSSAELRREGEGGSSLTRESDGKNGNGTGNGNIHGHGKSDGGVIHKNVVVEQSYEYVK